MYEHTQKAPLDFVLYAVAAVILATGVLMSEPWPVTFLLTGIAAITALVGGMFGSLTVRDEGEYLAIRYGPIPAFRFRFPYARVSGARRDRSTVLDGWGIHWFPGRGTTFNLWGFDCVTFRMGRRLIRIGTDDAENLAALLLEKTGGRERTEA